MSDPIAEIRAELFRLRARPIDVGPLDAIGVRAEASGHATLLGSLRRHPEFFWRGDPTEILERLRGLPDDGGPEAIRSEFG